MSDAFARLSHGQAERRALIEWGMAKADWLDPLVARPDDILDEELKEPNRFY